MSNRASALWIAVFVVLALMGGTRLLEGDEGKSKGGGLQLASSGRVVRVIDGDTVRVRFGDETKTVRYIGVDTPESVRPGEPVQCFAKRASAFNRRLVGGRRIRVSFGPERFDRYGRLLAYVHVVGRRGRSVNAVIVAKGYGRVLTIAPNTDHTRPYTRLERLAQRRGLGLWSACPLP